MFENQTFEKTALRCARLGAINIRLVDLTGEAGHRFESSSESFVPANNNKKNTLIIPGKNTGNNLIRVWVCSRKATVSLCRT